MAEGTRLLSEYGVHAPSRVRIPPSPLPPKPAPRAGSPTPRRPAANSPHRRPRPGWKANWKDATGRSPRTPTRATPTAPRAWHNAQAENRPNAHAHIARSTQRDGGARARVTAPVGALTGGSAPRQGRQHPSRVSTCFPAPGDPAPRAAWRARPCSVSRGRPCAGHRPQSVVMAPSAGDRGLTGAVVLAPSGRGPQLDPSGRGTVVLAVALALPKRTGAPRQTSRRGCCSRRTTPAPFVPARIPPTVISTPRASPYHLSSTGCTPTAHARSRARVS